MGLSNKKEEELRDMPIIKAQITKSKDGRFIIHRTTITHIKPVNYFKAVMEDSEPEEEIISEEEIQTALNA